MYEDIKINMYQYQIVMRKCCHSYWFKSQLNAAFHTLFISLQSTVQSKQFSFSWLVRLLINKTLRGFVFHLCKEKQTNKTKQDQKKKPNINTQLLLSRLAFISSFALGRHRWLLLNSWAAPVLLVGHGGEERDARNQPWQWWIWQEESVNDIPSLMAVATSHTFAFPFIILTFIIMGWLPDLITVPG